MATKWLNDDELRAWRNMSLMQLQLNAVLGHQLQGTELSYQDYMVLAGLSDSALPVRMSDIGRWLGWEKSRLSHHVSRMADRGLVERIKCPTDGRGWFVAMTPVGRAAIEAAAPGHVATVRQHFIDLLTPKQIEQLDNIAQTVLDHLVALPHE